MEELRTSTESDFQEIVKLNDAEVRHTSQMDLERLLSLVQLAAYCKVVPFREGSK